MKNAYIVVTVVLLAIVAVVYLVKQQAPEPPLLPPETTDTEMQVQPDHTEDTAATSGQTRVAYEGDYEPLAFPDNAINTSEWETYRSDEAGFEIKYPKGWEVDFRLNKPSDSGYVGTLELEPTQLRTATSSVEVFKVRNMSLDEQIEEQKNSEIMTPPPIRNVTVNNTVGFETEEFQGPGFYVHERYVLAGSNDTTYEFSGLNAPNAATYKEEIEQIILSFKLLK